MYHHTGVAPYLNEIASEKNLLKEQIFFAGAGTLVSRGGVEDTRLEATAKDTKKSRGQGQGQPFRGLTTRGRGQGPRTQPQMFPKNKNKKVFKKVYQVISDSLTYPEFLIGGGLNHKSHEMTSSKFFQKGSFCGTKLL